MIKRQGPFSALFQIVFALPFAGSGVLLVARCRNFLDAIVGLTFVSVGGALIVHALRRGRSPESQAPVGESSHLADAIPQITLGYRAPAARPRTASEFYAPILATAPLPPLETAGGSVFPVRLPLAASPHDAWPLIAILWNTFAFPSFAVAVICRQVGTALFLSVFVALGVLVAVMTMKKVLSREKLPNVELGEEPVFVGDELRLHVEQVGPARVTRLRIELLCRESASYTEGTSKTSVDNDVFQQELFDEPGENLARGQRWRLQLTVKLPNEQPHSFRSKNNAIKWLLRVRAEIAGWPDYDEFYEFRVLPRPVP